MYKIIEKADLPANVFRYIVRAPDIARKTRAGQFVILRLDDRGERIPITIADVDTDAGTVTLFVQAVGKTTIQMSRLKSGDAIRDLVGPLGEASHIEKAGTAAIIGGGFGIAAIHPIAREHKRIGNRTVSILGARTRELLIMEEEMRRVSTEVRIATNDGSYGKQGIVTDILNDMIANNERPDLVVAIGPMVMMKAVADVTRPHQIKTVVSLNPIMIDGTGMCGACRVTVGNKMKFACVDGPEFDAHQIDFDILLSRLKMYIPEEKESLGKYQRESEAGCRLAAKA